MGISNTFATIPGIVSPLLTGHIVTSNVSIVTSNVSIVSPLLTGHIVTSNVSQTDLLIVIKINALNNYVKIV